MFHLYVLSLPFVDVLSFHPWAPLPLMICLLLLLRAVPSHKVLSLERDDTTLFAIIVLGTIPYIWSYDYLGPKATNHLMALTTVIVLSYWVPRQWIRVELAAKHGWNNISKLLAAALFITSVYIIAEFVATNAFGVSRDGLLPHTDLTYKFDPQILSYKRPRGFASEPGHMALFYELSVFIVWRFLRAKPVLVQLGYWAVVLAGFILLSSTAAVISIVIAGVVYVAWYGLKRPREVLGGLAVAVALAIGLCWLTADQMGDFIRDTALVKVDDMIFGSRTLGLARSSRHSQYQVVFDLAKQYPAGIGYGVTSQTFAQGRTYEGMEVFPGQISLIGYFLVSAGYLGALLFIVFLARRLIRANRCVHLQSALVPTGIALFTHHMFVAEQCLPFLWFYLALVDAAYSCQRRRERATARLETLYVGQVARRAAFPAHVQSQSQ